MSLQNLIEICLDGRDPLTLARGQAGRWDSWLIPISDDAPAGEDPAYDDDFQRMRDEVNKLSGADTAWVARQAQTVLSERCKDLRVATYYLWARLQRDGEAGFAEGLSLLAALLERYADKALPARTNSRRLALEWLASGKVLDGLARHPAVVKSEAQDTVAALAWLQQLLDAGPIAHRPELGPLYTALAQRLAQSGGVDAVVPQHSAAAVESAASTSCPGSKTIGSGRDLLDNGRALASYLREQPLGWLAAHRLMTHLRWDTVHVLPVQETSGLTRLLPPRAESAAQLKRLYSQQQWRELLEQAERLFAEAVNHFWLDLQWYLYQALTRLDHPHAAWADILKSDLRSLLERLPGLERLCWNDGTPFAQTQTLDWIAQPLPGDTPRHASVTPPSCGAEPDVLDAYSEALAEAEHQGVDAAIAWLAQRPDVYSGRQRWFLRLLMARIAEQHGRQELAVQLLETLDATAQRQALGDWEPVPVFEVKARLYKLLRQKAQRSDADRSGLARRQEGLLGELVALDPVRAAVLCG